MKHRKGYTLKNQAEDDRAALYIYGDIMSDDEKGFYEFWGLDSSGVSPKSFRDALEAVGDKPLDLYINSDGGDVQAGLGIINILKRRKGETVGYIDGWAASMAGLIFLACPERHMPKGTFLMLHRPLIGYVSGNVDDVQKALDYLTTVTNESQDFIDSKVKDPDAVETVNDNFINEHWYTADEAADYFDIVLDAEDDDYKAVASIRNYKNIPAGLRRLMDQANGAPVVDENKAALQRAKALIAATEIIYS